MFLDFGCFKSVLNVITFFLPLSIFAYPPPPPLTQCYVRPCKKTIRAHKIPLFSKVIIVTINKPGLLKIPYMNIYETLEYTSILCID